MVRAAVVQAAAVGFDRERTLAKVEELAAEVGGRTPAGRDEFKRYWEGAVDVPGPAVDRLAELARTLGIELVVPVIERDGGTLYCTALFFSTDSFLGKHRKLMPTASERLIWGFGDGSTLPVFDTGVGRVGAVICWENYMPMLRMKMYSKGIQFYCAPTADDRETWLSTVRHIALEGRCFVLSCCQFARRGDYPKNYATDLDDIVRGKYDFDVVGHHARPDVFELQVNERAAQPVVSRPITESLPLPNP